MCSGAGQVAYLQYQLQCLAARSNLADVTESLVAQFGSFVVPSVILVTYTEAQNCQLVTLNRKGAKYFAKQYNIAFQVCLGT